MPTRLRLILLAMIVSVILPGTVSAQGPEKRVSVLAQLAPGIARNHIRAFAASQGGHVRYEYNILPNVINLRNIPVTALKGLQNVPGVVRISEDPVIKVNIQDSVPLIRGLQSQIQSEGLSANGEGIRICVPDTGIDSNHYMFQDWPDTSRTRIDYAAARNFVTPGTFPEDDHGHGAHVSGIAAGREGLVFNGLPFQGIAPKATIIPVKVLDSTGSGQGSDLIAAFQHCTDSSSPSGGRAHVISLSLGYGAFSDRTSCDADEVVNAANAAVLQGRAVVVAASGNDGSDGALSAPACGSQVISVGGTWDRAPTLWDSWLYCPTGYFDEVLCFSNKSEMLDVVAPGCGIHSAATDLIFDMPDGGTEMCGTSMAAPHVAGLAALLWQTNPGLIPSGIRQCIRDGAIDKGPVGFDPAYGYGRIDVINSLNLCRPAGPPNQPPSASFNYQCTGLTCTFNDSGSTDPDGNIIAWAWNFGDGTQATGASVSHAYASGGDYNVLLSVTDDDGATGQASQMVSVNSPPTASFTYSCTGLTCSFDGSGSSDPGGTIVSYFWSFGDGGTGSGVSVEHSYASSGTYPVTLTVTDDDGATQYQSQSVTVASQPVTVPNAPSNLNVQVTSTGTGKKTRYTVNLAWQDNANNEDSFVVRRFKRTGRKNQQTCSFELESTLPANTTGYADSSASTSTCRYAVGARNSAGYSGFVEKSVTIP